MSLKKVEISIGLIKLQSSFICIRRNKAPYKNFIEFPGGKKRNNETAIQCLKREIKEELNIKIDKSKFIGTIKHLYDDVLIIINIFNIYRYTGQITSNENRDIILFDEKSNQKALFTGDTLFIGDIGRPDLAVDNNLSVNDLASMLYDSLYDLLDFEKIQKKIEIGDIEIAPLAFMRGRTLKNSFAILDEAQNATDTQIKMFLTRIGENSKIVINGDPSQIDLPNKTMSGLNRSKKLLGHLKEISVVDFDHTDVVRHPLVSKIVKAYSDKNSD